MSNPSLKNPRSSIISFEEVETKVKHDMEVQLQLRMEQYEKTRAKEQEEKYNALQQKFDQLMN